MVNHTPDHILDYHHLFDMSSCRMNFQYIVIVGCLLLLFLVGFLFDFVFCVLLSCFAFLPCVGSVWVVWFNNIILTV